MTLCMRVPLDSMLYTLFVQTKGTSKDICHGQVQEIFHISLVTAMTVTKCLQWEEMTFLDFQKSRETALAKTEKFPAPMKMRTQHQVTWAYQLLNKGLLWSYSLEFEWNVYMKVELESYKKYEKLRPGEKWRDKVISLPWFSMSFVTHHNDPNALHHPRLTFLYEFQKYYKIFWKWQSDILVKEKPGLQGTMMVNTFRKLFSSSLEEIFILGFLVTNLELLLWSKNEYTDGSKERRNRSPTFRV